MDTNEKKKVISKYVLEKHYDIERSSAALAEGLIESVEYRGVTTDIPGNYVAIPALGYGTIIDITNAVQYALYYSFPNLLPDNGERIALELAKHICVGQFSKAQTGLYHIFSVKG